MQSFMTSVGGRATSIAAALFITGAASASAQTFSYDFNSTTADFDANFVTPGHNPGILPTSGLNGTGAIDRSTGQPIFAYYNTAIGRFANAGDVATASYYWNGYADTNGRSEFLAFATSPTLADPLGGTTNAGVKAALTNTGYVTGTASNTTYAFLTQNAGNGTDTIINDSNVFQIGTDNLDGTGTGASDWYFMTLRLTYKGGNNFDIASSLSESTATGMVGTELDSFSVVNQTITGLANVDLFAAFQSASYGGAPIRSNHADNFSTSFTPVPEPTSLAVLGLAGLLGLSRRRAL